MKYIYIYINYFFLINKKVNSTIKQKKYSKFKSSILRLVTYFKSLRKEIPNQLKLKINN